MQTLEDKILLQFGDNRKHLQPHEIEADNTDKEVAISNLVKKGYVTAIENRSFMYDRYISISITTEGKSRQKELLRLMSRTRYERFCDGVGSVWSNVKPSSIRIVEVVIGGAILALLSLWIGHIFTP